MTNHAHMEPTPAEITIRWATGQTVVTTSHLDASMEWSRYGPPSYRLEFAADGAPDVDDWTPPPGPCPNPDCDLTDGHDSNVHRALLSLPPEYVREQADIARRQPDHWRSAYGDACIAWDDTHPMPT